jgi:hypothetical protein
VAKVIEFNIPSNFCKKARPTPVEQREKVIEFDSWKGNRLEPRSLVLLGALHCAHEKCDRQSTFCLL